MTSYRYSIWMIGGLNIAPRERRVHELPSESVVAVPASTHLGESGRDLYEVSPSREPHSQDTQMAAQVSRVGLLDTRIPLAQRR